MLIVLAGRLAQFAIAFLSVKLMTTLLSPVEVGQIALVTTATALFALFLINPVGMFINRRLHTWVKTGLLRHYFHLYFWYLMGVAIMAALLTWTALHNHLWGSTLPSAWCAALIAGSLLFNTINQTLVPSMNMLGQTRPFVTLTIGTLTFGLLVSVVLVEWLGANAAAWLTGPIISQIVFSFLAYKVFFRDRVSQFRNLEGADYRRIFNFAWPISLAMGLNWLHMQGYRFILADRFGLAELGLYAAGYGVAAALTNACESITTTWFQPRFYRESNSTDASVRAKAWPHYASTMLPFTILASSGVFITSPYLTCIMLGPSYHTAVPYVMTGALAEWGRTLFNIFSLDAHGSMNTRRLIVPSLIGVAVAYAGITVAIHMKVLTLVPIALLAGCVVMSAAIRLRASRAEACGRIDWRTLIVSVGVTACLCIAFELCRQRLLPTFGSFEPYGALLIALPLWGSVSLFFLRLHRLTD